jgi:hypothetical protein
MTSFKVTVAGREVGPIGFGLLGTYDRPLDLDLPTMADVRRHDQVLGSHGHLRSRRKHEVGSQQRSELLERGTRSRFPTHPWIPTLTPSGAILRHTGPQFAASAQGLLHEIS